MNSLSPLSIAFIALIALLSLSTLRPAHASPLSLLKQATSKVEAEFFPMADDDEDDDDFDDSDLETRRDDLDDDDAEQLEREWERELDISVSDFKIEIESSVESEFNGTESESELEIELDISDGEAKLEIKEETKFESDTVESKEKRKLKARLLQIVEFNGTAPFDGTQTVVSRYHLSQKTWNAFSDTAETVGNATVTKFSTSTTDDVFSFVAAVTNQLAETTDAILTPTSVKIDFAISDFPFAASNDTQLALCMKVRSKSKQRIEFEDESVESRNGYARKREGAVDLGGAFFSWVKTASCGTGNATISFARVNLVVADEGDDDDDDDVLEAGDSDDDVQVAMCFTFEGCRDDIVWDPKIGTTPEALETSGASRGAVVSVALTLLMGVVLMVLSA